MNDETSIEQLQIQLAAAREELETVESELDDYLGQVNDVRLWLAKKAIPSTRIAN
jgi:hypothetical protein